jgi:hypothetical protein
MTYEILDPGEFLVEGMFRQDQFLEKADAFTWDRYRDKKVLVRGCTSTVIPPWAYMLITARLANVARSVRFGNEHDNIVVLRSRP